MYNIKPLSYGGNINSGAKVMASISINLTHELRYLHLYHLEPEDLAGRFSELKQAENLYDAFTGIIQADEEYEPTSGLVTNETATLADLNAYLKLKTKKAGSQLSNRGWQFLALCQNYPADCRLIDIQLNYTGLDISQNNLRAHHAAALKAIPPFITRLVLQDDAIENDHPHDTNQAEVNKLKAFFKQIPSTVTTIDLSQNGALLGKFNAAQLKDIFASLPSTVTKIVADDMHVGLYWTDDQNPFDVLLKIKSAMPKHVVIEADFNSQFEQLKVMQLNRLCQNYLEYVYKVFRETNEHPNGYTLDNYEIENNAKLLADGEPLTRQFDDSQLTLLKKYHHVVQLLQCEGKEPKQKFENVRAYLAENKLELSKHRNDSMFSKLLNAISGLLLMVPRAVFYNNTDRESIKHPLFWRSHSEQLAHNLENTMSKEMPAFK